MIRLKQLKRTISPLRLAISGQQAQTLQPWVQMQTTSEIFRTVTASWTLQLCRYKSSSNGNIEDISSLFVPVPVKITNDQEFNIGEELAGKLNKEEILNVLNNFCKRKPVRDLCRENGLDKRLFNQAFLSFRQLCLESESLPVELHLIFSDVLQNSGHPDDIFPFFMKHARRVFPHLECMDELQNISDVREPANWYPEARAMNRKIIFHAGPTNSGKTYHALERFFTAKTGVYCGPLKLLAVEIYNKSKVKGVPCDLITGEEKRQCNEDGSSASHVACTVEMTSTTTPYEVAVIDEIQMLRDNQRGWAWTRALLGVPAEEIHVCGEEAAINIVQSLLDSVEEDLEIRRYKRLSKLSIEDTALGSLDKVRAGDCIVCFSRNDIFTISQELEKLDVKFAVIYGALPPGTKHAQAQKFNDPDDPCNVLVATDAVGMGINLNIERIIFNSLIKPNVNEKGELEMEHISTSQALQIAGRAGRYGSEYETGYVTTLSPQDLPQLKSILSQPVQPIVAAGLLPTAEQLEMFAYYLPNASLSNLVDIFISLCQLDLQNYFMCLTDNFKFLADMIQHIPLNLKVRYVFCCAPVAIQKTMVCTMFLRFARQYSRNEPLTFEWLCHHLSWPFKPPLNIVELIHLEAVFDTLDIYLWLSYRFQDLFVDAKVVRDMQCELDTIVLQGIINITKLLKASETKITSAMTKTHDNTFILKKKKDDYKHELAVSVDGSETESQAVATTTKLTDRLLAKGLLTPEMVQQIKKEMLEETNQGELAHPKRKTTTKKRRK